MDELYQLLKDKLKEMKDNYNHTRTLDYYDAAKLYQMVCMMKQIRDIVKWGE